MHIDNLYLVDNSISYTKILSPFPSKLGANEVIKIKAVRGKPANIPLEQNHLLALVDGRLLHNPEIYRPKLSYCVHTLSQFMQQQKEEHWQVALRVLYGWCDSNWASFPLTRRSLIGWFVLLGLD
ncbi:hypothetical protein CR513_02415, partial [Mucuna pruriens]